MSQPRAQGLTSSLKVREMSGKRTNLMRSILAVLMRGDLVPCPKLQRWSMTTLSSLMLSWGDSTPPRLSMMTSMRWAVQMTVLWRRARMRTTWTSPRRCCRGRSLRTLWRLRRSTRVSTSMTARLDGSRMFMRDFQMWTQLGLLKITPPIVVSMMMIDWMIEWLIE